MKFNAVNNELITESGLWYDLKNAVHDKLVKTMQLSDDELLQECRFVLEDAVKIRLRSDVPVAVALRVG